MEINDFTPPCTECGGRCCKYVAIGMDKPSTKKDYDNIRWYLLHENINVFIDHDGNWFTEFRTDCSVQNSNHGCNIYVQRPEICKGHGNAEGECEFYDYPYKEYFSVEKDFLNYLKKKKIDWQYKRIRKK